MTDRVRLRMREQQREKIKDIERYRKRKIQRKNNIKRRKKERVLMQAKPSYITCKIKSQFIKHSNHFFHKF